MSGLQIGDIIRLAELSWTIYNYGWGNDFQASESRPSCWPALRVVISPADSARLFPRLVEVRMAFQNPQNPFC